VTRRALVALAFAGILALLCASTVQCCQTNVYPSVMNSPPPD